MVVTVASRGTGTHEVLQVALPAAAGAFDAIHATERDYRERHGTLPDGSVWLADEPLPDGRTSHTVLVYARDGEDPS